MDTFKLVKQEIPTITIQLETLKGAWVKIKKYLPVGEARKIDLQNPDKMELGVQMMRDCIVEWNICGDDNNPLPIDSDTIDLIPLSDFNLLMKVMGEIIGEGYYNEEKKA